MAREHDSYLGSKIAIGMFILCVATLAYAQIINHGIVSAILWALGLCFLGFIALVVAGSIAADYVENERRRHWPGT